MNREEIIHTLALTRIKGLSQNVALHLYRSLGGATEVFKLERIKEHVTPKIFEKLQQAFESSQTEALHRAETEVAFCEKKGIRILTLNDEAYPYRLREIPDPPLAIFFKGNADFNVKRVIAIVGTRKISEYGKDICHIFLSKIRELSPETLILSGLAYGVDIRAHRACLENNLPTIGILAHGLDRIYPSMHRDTAVKMVEHGGLLTEYMTETNPDKINFVRRNRIVAGMADATIVIESAEKGGALITANLALDFNREVFAFPGRINDEYSQGCNKLIAEQKAGLITSATDFLKAMNWDVQECKQASPTLTLFPVLNEEEERIWNALEGAQDGITANTLCVQLNVPIHKIISNLSIMVSNGWVKPLTGGRYKLLPVT